MPVHWVCSKNTGDKGLAFGKGFHCLAQRLWSSLYGCKFTITALLSMLSQRLQAAVVLHGRSSQVISKGGWPAGACF